MSRNDENMDEPLTELFNNRLMKKEVAKSVPICGHLRTKNLPNVFKFNENWQSSYEANCSNSSLVINIQNIMNQEVIDLTKDAWKIAFDTHTLLAQPVKEEEQESSKKEIDFQAIKNNIEHELFVVPVIIGNIYEQQT